MIHKSAEKRLKKASNYIKKVAMKQLESQKNIQINHRNNNKNTNNNNNNKNNSNLSLIEYCEWYIPLRSYLISESVAQWLINIESVAFISNELFDVNDFLLTFSPKLIYMSIDSIRYALVDSGVNDHNENRESGDNANRNLLAKTKPFYSYFKNDPSLNSNIFDTPKIDCNDEDTKTGSNSKWHHQPFSSRKTKPKSKSKTKHKANTKSKKNKNKNNKNNKLKSSLKKQRATVSKTIHKSMYNGLDQHFFHDTQNIFDQDTLDSIDLVCLYVFFFVLILFCEELLLDWWFGFFDFVILHVFVFLSPIH